MMKTLYLIIAMLLPALFSLGQPIYVSLNQTTSVVFKEKIKHADLGSNQGIGFQLEDNIPKIIKIRINEYFPSVQYTNMLIVTESDKIYSFRIQYKPDNTKFIFSISDSLAINTELPTPIIKPFLNTIQDSIYKVLINQEDYLTRTICKKQGKIIFCLNSIYTRDSVLYFCCELQNCSNLTYKIDFFNMYLTDQKKMRATTIQDLPINFSFLGHKPANIPARSTQKFIIQTPKFTMEKNKLAAIEIYEQNGGRHPEIKFGNVILLEAKILN